MIHLGELALAFMLNLRKRCTTNSLVLKGLF